MRSPVDALLPAEIALRAQDAGAAKAAMDAPRTLVLGVLAGAFIALGAAFSTTATAGFTGDYGLGRLVGGLTFSLGLVLVIGAGAELFTGNTLIVMAAAGGRVGPWALLRNWTLVYLGNFAGATATAGLVFVSEQYLQGHGAVGLNALRIASAKTGIGFLPAVALGVLCNVLVCLAVWLSLGARSAGDRILAVLLPVTAFVTLGFEHSVANMYFVPLGLLIRDFGGEAFWAATGSRPEAWASLGWGRFLTGNLLPVTLGNILGGAFLVGLVYWFVYLRPAPHAKS